MIMQNWIFGCREELMKKFELIFKDFLKTGVEKSEM